MANILVVDDDKSIVDLLEYILTRKKYTVCAAYDGKEGLAIAKREKPDLIILDIMMPVMDGVSVSGILFQDPVLRMTPVIILTAKSSSQELFALLPNVRTYMTKPFEPSELVKNIERLLGVSSSNALPPAQPSTAPKKQKNQKTAKSHRR